MAITQIFVCIKNTNRMIEYIENKLEVFRSKEIIVIFILCAISLTLRLYFTRFDFPLESQDAFIYLLQAKEISEGGLPPPHTFPITYGWQAFLAIIFSPIKFDENIGYMTILRITSISISVLTIPIIYKLAGKILEKKYALLASAFFAFGPNLIENSIFGITEPIFIFCGILSIFFALRNNIRDLILASLFAGFALDIRMNGIVLFIILTIVCFTKLNTKEQKIKNFLIFLVFFVIASSPFFVQSYVSYGSPFGFAINLGNAIQTNVAPSLDAAIIDNNLTGKFKIAMAEEFKHIFRISIPYLVLFVPFGLVILFKNFNYGKKIIFLTIIVSLLVAIPQYTLSLEYRNLFFILPFFSIIGALGIQFILSKNSRKNIFLVLLVGGIILLSYNMLRERNDVDLELLEEKEQFGKFVANSFKGKLMGDLYTQIAHHLPDAKLGTKIGEQIRNDELILSGFGPPSKTISNTIQYAQQNEITHLIIDDKYEARSPEFVEVYFNEEDYSYLEKVFDSTQNGYRKLHVKIFEIDYNKLE